MIAATHTTKTPSRPNPHQDPQSPAKKSEILRPAGFATDVARRPVLVTYDFDYGWIVEIPTVHQMFRDDDLFSVEYEFAHHHVDGTTDPENRADAIVQGRSLAELIGGGIVIDKKPILKGTGRLSRRGRAHDCYTNPRDASVSTIIPIGHGIWTPIAKRPVLVTGDDGSDTYFVEVATVPSYKGEKTGRFPVQYAEACDHIDDGLDENEAAKLTYREASIESARRLAQRIGAGYRVHIVKAQPTPKVNQPNRGEKFIAYAARLWGNDWVVARKTRKNLARYARCLTRKEYETAKTAWEAAQN